MGKDDHLRAERLNSEPPIFRGCSSSELGMIVLVATVFWLPVSFALAGWLGAFTMGAGAAALGILATVVVTVTAFQSIKRGRPDGYYQQRLAIFLHDAKLRRCLYIRRSGAWDIGRTQK